MLKKENIKDESGGEIQNTFLTNKRGRKQNKYNKKTHTATAEDNILKEIQENFISLLDNPVSRVFVMKVFEFLKNNNMILLRDLLWPLYRNIAVINYIVANKSQKKFLKQLIELSDDEQKIYLYILLKRSNW